MSGLCMEKPGEVAGGGAIELVAESGEIIIGDKIEICFGVRFLPPNYLTILLLLSKTKCGGYTQAVLTLIFSSGVLCFVSLLHKETIILIENNNSRNI